MNTIATLWNGLPRAAKWGVYSVLIVTLYFVMVERVLNLTSGFRSDADRIEAALRRERELSSPDSDDGRLLAISRRLFGTPLLPADPNARPESLLRAVDRILRDHGIEDPALNEHSAAMQIKPGDPAAALAGPGQALDRFAIEVTFESDPETAIGVISELETAPEVTAIGRVRIDKGSARSGFSRSGAFDDLDTVRVTVAPELWLRARRDAEGAAP